MKKFFLVITALVLCGLVGYCAEGNYAEATFPNKTHDFGIIKESKGSVTTQFEFVNTGSKPLIIIEATASCGCTRPEYPKRPIAPGKKGVIKVTYSPIGRPGAFKKNIKVKTNGREKITALYIEGTTIPMDK